MKSSCYKCEGASGSATEVVFGYTICSTCISELRLFNDKTIKKHVTAFDHAKEKDSTLPSYSEDVKHKLNCLDKDYINKRIKLLHIQERLEKMS